MKITKQGIKKYFLKVLHWLSSCLTFSYAISFLAAAISFLGLLSLFYFFDLFSHFTLQYMIGGFILGTVFLLLDEKKLAIFPICIFLFCFIEIRWNLHNPFEFFPENSEPVYKIATYNHHISQDNFEEISAWLKNETPKLDIVVLQEANDKTAQMGESLKEIYPYQIHEQRDHPFGTVILSRYPFEGEMIVLDGPLYPSFAVRFEFKTPQAKNPLAVYALHPHPPTSPIAHAQRDFELMEVARRIKEDKSENIIMVGDWNITPFAPAFHKLLKTSGLHFQSYGLLLNPTWPSYNFYDFLKIPIDHVLYSDGLKQVEKSVLSSYGSDHHAMIASYTESVTVE